MNASHGYHNQNFGPDITASIYVEVLNKLYSGSRLQLNFFDHRRHIMANAESCEFNLDFYFFFMEAKV